MVNSPLKLHTLGKGMIGITFIIVFTGLLLAAVIVFVRILRIRRQLHEQTIILSDRLANFYGRSTQGQGQIRGNGWLLLIKDDLRWEMYLPARSLVIPLNSILSVDTTPAHLGKTGKAGQLLLRITYTDGEQEECAAWKVDQTQQWVSSINKRRKQVQ
ncbi:hypothetical protein [Paenibacillus sp. FSL H3-0469]|uniref:hypothetical protein n=1 Tax=Paenibacillus sp. FSL H3-0469 TaxID=2954506 RepID=UPI003100CB43